MYVMKTYIIYMGLLYTLVEDRLLYVAIASSTGHLETRLVVQSIKLVPQPCKRSRLVPGYERELSTPCLYYIYIIVNFVSYCP